jgi:hypothetical protein
MPKFSLSLSWHDQPCPFLALLAQGQLSRHSSKKKQNLTSKTWRRPAMVWSGKEQKIYTIAMLRTYMYLNTKQINICRFSSSFIHIQYKDVWLAQSRRIGKNSWAYIYNYHTPKATLRGDNTTKWFLKQLIDCWAMSCQATINLCLSLQIKWGSIS